MLSSDSYPAGARGRQLNARQNSDDRPSRFLVDLNRLPGGSEAAGDSRDSKLTSLADKLAVLTGAVKKFSPGRGNTIPDAWVAPDSPDLNESEAGSGSSAVAAGALGARLNGLPWPVIRRLAFFPLLSLAAKGFARLMKKIYKISVYCGWLAVFLIRFIYLSGAKLGSLGLTLATAFYRRVRLFKKRDEKKYIAAEPDLSGRENPDMPDFTPEKNPAPDRPDHYILNLKPPASPDNKPAPPEPEILPALKRSLVFRPRLALLKPAAFAAVIMFILVLPLKSLTYIGSLEAWRGRVLGVTEAAVGEIFNGARLASEHEFAAAQDRFSEAKSGFSGTREEIAYLSRLLRLLAPVVPAGEVRLAAQAEHLLRAGELAAVLGAESARLYERLSSREQWSSREALAALNDYLAASGAPVAELRELIGRIDPGGLPADYRETFALAKETTGMIAASWREIEKLAESLGIFLGFERDQRYLFVFQNNTEMRASGGFIGSYALIDFRDGEIKRIEAPGGGSYDTEAGLRHKIIAPEPLHLVRPLWHFWDANWWPDWPATAEKLMWFYEKSDGPTVDGVISLTPTVIEDILRVIGPVELRDEYGLVLTADNFWLEVQALAERKPDETNRPKEIIGDALDAIMSELPGRLDNGMLFDLLKLAEKHLREKHILLYFTDDRLESNLADFGWDGAVSEARRDYLMVVNTNIAGGKSDRVMRETISHRAAVGADGTIVNTVEVKREHTGEKIEPYSGVRNVNWVRVYVPEGSELLEAGGFDFPDERYFDSPEEHWQADPDVARFEGRAVTDPATKTKIYNENGKTVFANWTMVDPGNTITYYFKYRLPFRLEPVENERNEREKGTAADVAASPEYYAYSLLAQKQPGSIGSRFISELDLPERFKAAWTYPDSADGAWRIDDFLKVDKYYAALLKTGG